ncbi:MAG: TolC family protein [Prevotellaceae bacterium]|jgi:outer membrane protein TolC|nr:TolC family protein [Prevotellaceae bacterium]
MKKISNLGYCVLLVFLPFSGSSQNNDTLHVNLQQALEIALSDNPTILIADHEIKRVDYSKKNAWLGLLPSVSGTAQYSKFLVPASMSMMGQVMDSPTDFNASLGVSLSLPLFAPALWRSIQMSALDMQLAVEKAYASKVTLRNDVTKAYYNILLAQDSYKSLQDGYSVAQQNYEEAKRRFELGLAAEYDYISAEVQMNNLLPTLLQVETGIAQAKLYLKVLMGVDRATPIAVKGNLADFETGVAATGTRNITLSGNADLRQLDIQQQLLYKSLQLQHTQWMPTLAAFGNYNYSGTGNRETTLNFGGMPIAVPASTDWFGQGLIVGLQLNVPIFNGSSNLIKTKQINLQRKELALQRDYLESSLSVQAHTALDNMDKAVKQMDAAKKGVTLSEKGYNISAKRYETGAGTMLELHSAALALTQSRLAYHQAISDYLNAKADYEKTVGGL